MQVAECAGVLVGYNCIRLFARREAQLARMAVAPAWQGRGLGRALLVDALNAAMLGGSRTVSLNTQADNHRAQQLYARYGFHFTGQQMTVFTRLDGGA
jgi:ribosomal protein S18 acetylase RimI-like enzyme